MIYCNYIIFNYKFQSGLCVKLYLFKNKIFIMSVVGFVNQLDAAC